jgi:hypothetical protein
VDDAIGAEFFLGVDAGAAMLPIDIDQVNGHPT